MKEGSGRVAAEGLVEEAHAEVAGKVGGAAHEAGVPVGTSARRSSCSSRSNPATATT